MGLLRKCRQDTSMVCDMRLSAPGSYQSQNTEQVHYHGSRHATVRIRV